MPLCPECVWVCDRMCECELLGMRLFVILKYNVTPLISYSVECGCSNPKLHILFDLIFYV